MDAGLLIDPSTQTLFAGDLFAQPGADGPAITEGDIFGPSEAMRQAFPYAPITNAGALLAKLASTEATTLACMHGSSYRGDGGALLRELARAIGGDA